MDQTSDATGIRQPGRVGAASPCGDPPQPRLHGGHGREERAAAIPRRGEDRLRPGTPVTAGAPRCHGHTGAGFFFSSSQEPEQTSLSSVLWPPTPTGCQASTHSAMGVVGPWGSHQGEQYTAPRASPRGLGVPSHSHRGQAGHQGGCGTRSHQGDNRNKYGEGVAQARACPQPQRSRAPRPRDVGWLWRWWIPPGAAGDRDGM